MSKPKNGGRYKDNETGEIFVVELDDTGLGMVQVLYENEGKNRVNLVKKDFDFEEITQE
jgi:hypothetical protein